MKHTKLIFIILITMVASAYSAWGESVVQRQISIGAPGVTYVDPEFEPDSMQVSFQSLKDGLLYIGKMDPVTGLFVDHNYQAIDTVAPIYRTFNGPEWGYSQKGASIYYTKADASGYYHNFRYRDGVITQLDSGNFNLVANYCSKDSENEATMVMGANFPPSSLQVNPLVLNWGVFSEENPKDIRYYPMTSIGKGPRYLPGSRKVTTNLLDAKGNLQIAIFDFDAGKTTQATFDAGRKNSATVFSAPELNGEEVLSTMVLTELGQNGTQKSLLTLLPNVMVSAYDKLSQTLGQIGQAIRVYRNIAGSWRPYREIKPKDGKLMMNVQSFSFKGKTYYSMEQFTLASVLTDHQIVIQDLEGKVNLVVGDSSKMVRFDPEVVVSGDKVFLYYYQIPGFQLYMSEIKL